jgi:hypothetical protein
MTSDSAADDHVAGSFPRVAWRAAVLLAAASIVTGLAVSLGLLTVFGPSPDRHVLYGDAPAFRGSHR